MVSFPQSAWPFVARVPADAAAIRDLTRSAYSKWVPLIEPTPMTADYDRAVRDYMIDLLFIDTELTALIETVSRADHLLIENLAVAPAFQGRGYGGLLLDHAEHLAASLGLPELRTLDQEAVCYEHRDLSPARLHDRLRRAVPGRLHRANEQAARHRVTLRPRCAFEDRGSRAGPDSLHAFS